MESIYFSHTSLENAKYYFANKDRLVISPPVNYTNSRTGVLFIHFVHTLYDKNINKKRENNTDILFCVGELSEKVFLNAIDN